jgi:hypothetical protein
MARLTDEGRARVAEIAARHGVAAGAAEHLLGALDRGGGTQAQFNHPELGGMGQWSRGGMIMIGDMFNSGLKARVDTLCNALSALLAESDLFAPEPAPEPGAGIAFGAPAGWPAELGRPSASGSQNDMRYAVFPDSRRLAVARGGTVTIYDTGDHRIGGVSQAQSGDQTLTFSSPLGPVRVSDLAVVAGTDPQPSARRAPDAEGAPVPAALPAAAEPAEPAAGRTAAGSAVSGDILTTIERLAGLRTRGVLTEDEFARKKAELLARL